VRGHISPVESADCFLLSVLLIGEYVLNPATIFSIPVVIQRSSPPQSPHDLVAHIQVGRDPARMIPITNRNID